MAKVKQVSTIKTTIRKTLNSSIKKKKGIMKAHPKTIKIIRRRPRSLLIERKERGVVYLSHIPHGFYEEQIEGFFGQFGKVSQVSLPRSKSGKSKGYAFIEFIHPEVAEIAAETMNNYLMFNRLLKAKYIPPQDQRPKLFVKARLLKNDHMTEQERAVLNVKENRKVKNYMLKTSQEAKIITKLQKKSAAMRQMMAELGVTYEVQVEKGNCESVLERMKNLQERKKLKFMEMQRKKKQAKVNGVKDENKKGLSSPSGGENISSPASSNKNLASSENEKGDRKNKKTISNKLSIKPQNKNKSIGLSSFKLKKQNQSKLTTNISNQKGVQKKVIFSTKKSPTNDLGKIKRGKGLGQQPKLFTKQKSLVDKELIAIKSNFLETAKEDTLKPTPAKKLKQSEPLKETVQSPRIKELQSSTFSKKSSKSPMTPLAKSSTPKLIGSSKKSPKPTMTPQAKSNTPKLIGSSKKSPKPTMTSLAQSGTPKLIGSPKKSPKPTMTPQAKSGTPKLIGSSAKSLKSTLTPQAKSITPKVIGSLKKSESLGKSSNKRKSQPF